MKKLSLLEVKQALWDERFRALFPEHKKEIAEFIGNPGCACNTDLYRKLLQYPDRLAKYFPTRDVSAQADQSNVSVINCHIDELESRLKKLTKQHKQVAIARWQDQVTVIINYPE